MNTSRRPPPGSAPPRPFSGVYAHKSNTVSGIRIVIGSPPHGFTPLQLRGVALLIDRCCLHPLATLISTGGLDIGVVDARKFSDVTTTLSQLDLIDDPRENYTDIACVYDATLTFRLYGSSLSVDAMLNMSSLMQRSAIHHIKFGADRTARFYFALEQDVSDFVSGLIALGLHPHRAM